MILRWANYSWRVASGRRRRRTGRSAAGPASAASPCASACRRSPSRPPPAPHPRPTLPTRAARLLEGRAGSGASTHWCWLAPPMQLDYVDSWAGHLDGCAAEEKCRAVRCRRSGWQEVRRVPCRKYGFRHVLTCTRLGRELRLSPAAGLKQGWPTAPPSKSHKHMCLFGHTNEHVHIYTVKGSCHRWDVLASGPAGMVRVRQWLQWVTERSCKLSLSVSGPQ